MKGMMKVKLVIALLVVIAVAIFYYVSLPAINIHATETWKFIFLILAVLFVLYIVRKAKIAGQSNAPARMGAVCQDADYGVEGGIPYPGDQEHGAYRGGRHTEHVGIKYHEIGTEELPEHGRGHVSQSVTYLFFEH